MEAKHFLERPITENEDPTWHSDRLGRQDFSGEMTRLLEPLEGPLTISVASPFGTGKSFFAERWMHEMVSSGKIVIKFNAWETDFSEEPLLAFICEVREQLKEMGLPKPSTDALDGKLKRAAKGALRLSARMATRYLFKTSAEELFTDPDGAISERGLEAGSKELEDLLQNLLI